MKLDVQAFAFTSALVWALADGLIGGAIFAWVYNWLPRAFDPAER